MGDDDVDGAIWNGTPNNPTSLSLTAYDIGSTYPLAASGGYQYGSGLFSPFAREYFAVRWQGSAASWMSMHPAQFYESSIFAADANQQVGYVFSLGSGQHAALWTGTAESCVEIHPPQWYGSNALAVANGSQFGYVYTQFGQGPYTTHASRWSGTAASWEDYTPLGSNGSSAVYGAFGDKQVGYTTANNVVRAVMWNNSASSWVDLHSYLPADFSSSYATAIWKNETDIRVVGYGRNSVTGRDEALLWRIGGQAQGCQPTWAEVTPTSPIPSPRGAAAVAYDSMRHVLVAFGGSTNSGLSAETWEWSASTGWKNATPAGASPSARYVTAMAYDAVRHVTVLFGGKTTSSGSGGNQNDTWEWNGATWTQKFPAQPLPDPRYWHAMAYDAGRQRVVVYAGSGVSSEANPSGRLDDLWEWDGVTWTARTPSNRPPARLSPGLAYDSDNHRLVVVGGYTSQGPSADTWSLESSGSAWASIPAGSGQSGRYDGGLAYDGARHKFVLVGGADNSGAAVPDQCWELAGNTWARSLLAAPAARAQCGVAYDPDGARTLMFAGDAGATTYQDLWGYNGTAWRPLATADQVTPVRAGAAMVTDTAGNRVLLFAGGSNGDTWAYSNGAWGQLFPSAALPFRDGFAFAYDTDRNRIVAFGGYRNVDQFLGDTWEFDGSQWTQTIASPVPGTNGPSTRFNSAMAYDPALHKVILFGGSVGTSGVHGTTVSGETWAYDPNAAGGPQWTNLTATLATAPSARANHGMAYDPTRQRIILHAGSTVDSSPDHTEVNDTWEWYSGAWHLVTATSTPIALPTRGNFGMAFDPTLGQVVVFGGYNGAYLSDAWAYSGATATWTRIAAAESGPSGRYVPSFGYDPARQRLVTYGGAINGGQATDTWELNTQATPSITLQPTSVVACTSGQASFSVSAAYANSASLGFVWRFNGVPITLPQARYTVTNSPDGLSSTLTIATPTVGEGGSYDCVVSSSCGSAMSGSATLTVNSAVTITSQPVGQAVCAGSPVSLSVSATGTATLAYQWRKGGVNMSDTATITGTTAATLMLNPASAVDAGTYDCVVSNGCGSVPSSGAALVVNAPVMITSQPMGQTLCAGSPFSLSVGAGGTAPLTYQWRKNGLNINGANASTLAFAALQAGDTGSYDCVVSNACGSVPSSAATLTVNSVPMIAVSPQAQAACPGSPATFSVTPTGTAPFTYQWRKAGVNIVGATGASYTTAAAAPADAASYSCVVSNACGSVTTVSAALSLNSVPSVVTNPASQTVYAGDAAVFTVSATGTPTPTYQWRKNGANIVGATLATYSIAVVTGNDAGSYDCVVSNACGSTMSAAAVLGVQYHAVIYVNASVAPGGDGLSWATAYRNLQQGLAAAGPASADGQAVQVWVARGTYRPDGGYATFDGLTNVLGTRDRSASFVVPSFVSVYGGFAGGETDTGQRSVQGNLTILSGDLSSNDTPGFGNNGDNAYHVVLVPDTAVGTALDGLIVEGGNANLFDDAGHHSGGGAVLNGISAIRGCTFRNNAAVYSAAGVAAGAHTYEITNCRFLNNRCPGVAEGIGGSGGGLRTDHGIVHLSQCVFAGNSAHSSGGAISFSYATASPSTVTNCVVYGNTCDPTPGFAAPFGGGLFANADAWVVVRNSILYANTTQYATETGGFLDIQYCDVQDTTPDSHNTPANPLFASPNGPAGLDGQLGTLDDDFHLLPNSPCVDRGSSAAAQAAGLMTDLDGNARFFDGDGDGVATVDIGAYEFAPSPTAWTSAAGGLWSDAARWTAGVPDASKIAVFDSRVAPNQQVAYTVSLATNQSAYSLRTIDNTISLSLYNGATATGGSLTLSAGAGVSDAGLVVGSLANHPASLQLLNGSPLGTARTVTASVGVIGDGVGAMGTVDVGTAATSAGQAAAPVALNVASRLDVGGAGSGTLRLNRNASATITSLHVGRDAGSTGTVELIPVAGAPTALSVGSAMIGEAGKGSLSVSAGASLTATSGDVRVGDGAGSGSLVVNGALNVSNGQLVIGTRGVLSGAGSVSAAGGVFNKGSLKPGNSPGTIDVDGGYKQIGPLTNGSQESGTLEMEIAGTASTQYDQLVVSGPVTIGGGLRVKFPGGVVPADLVSSTVPLRLIHAPDGPAARGAKGDAAGKGALAATLTGTFNVAHVDSVGPGHFLSPQYAGSGSRAARASSGIDFVTLVVGNLGPPINALSGPMAGAPATPSAAVTADVDGDGFEDLVIAVPGATPTSTGNVLVFRNQGVNPDGTWMGFAGSDVFPVGANPQSLVVADLSGLHARPQVYVANAGDGITSGSVQVMANASASGSVALTTSQVVTVGLDPRSLAAGGFANSMVTGREDVAVANSGSQTVTVLRNLGGATPTLTTAQVVTGVGSGSLKLAAICPDQDAPPNQPPPPPPPDSLAVLSPGTGMVRLLANPGVPNTASLQMGATLAVGVNAVDITAAKLKMGGVQAGTPVYQDLVVVNTGDPSTNTPGSLSILANTGQTTDGLSFASAVNRDVGGNPVSVAAADLDGDGDADLTVLTNASAGTVAADRVVVLRNDVYTTQANSDLVFTPDAQAAQQIQPGPAPVLVIAANLAGAAGGAKTDVIGINGPTQVNRAALGARGAGGVRNESQADGAAMTTMALIVPSYRRGVPSCLLDYNLDGSLNPDDIGDYITDYFAPSPVPGPGGYAILCPGNDPPYDQGYKTGYTPDGSGQCGEPNPDNLGDWITAYFQGC